MKKIKLITEILGIFCLTALIVLTIMAVCSRYLIKSPLAWAEELQMTCMLWAVMLGGIVAAWDKVALSIDLIQHFLNVKWKRYLSRFSFLVTALTMGPLVYYAWKLSIIGKGKITNILKIPYTYLDLAVFVGALGIGLISLVYVFITPVQENIKKQKNIEGE